MEASFGNGAGSIGQLMKRYWLTVLSAALLVAAAPKNQPHWPMFRKHLIDAGANESAAVADVNQDGRLDIIAGENWYEAPDRQRSPSDRDQAQPVRLK